MRAKASRKTLELFNLKDDPYEKNNLAESQPDRANELVTALAQLESEAAPPKRTPMPENYQAPAVWGEKNK